MVDDGIRMRAALNRKQRGVVAIAPIPNPYNMELWRVSVDGVCVGTYKKVEGGYLPIGARKPRATERDAQREVIQAKIRDLLRQTSPLMEALNEFVE